MGSTRHESLPPWVLREAFIQHAGILPSRSAEPDTAHMNFYKRGDFDLSLPLRYTRLPVRRKMVRIMLMLHKFYQTSCCQKDPGQDASTQVADYVRSVIDSAMLCGELRYRSSAELTYYCMSKARGLQYLMTDTILNNALLRSQIRCITSEFLNRYSSSTIM